MVKRVLFLFWSLLCCCIIAGAQDLKKSDLQQRAETEYANKHVATARSLYIKAYADYLERGLMSQGVECGVKATSLFYTESLYKEAFEFLHQVDQSIYKNKKLSNKEIAALRYYVFKERFQMYTRLKHGDRAKEQLNLMEQQANASGNDQVINDLLYHKTIYYYNTGQSSKGDATFKEMAAKLTADQGYDKIDNVYQTLIENGRKSGNAPLVASTYKSYLAWKDSVTSQIHTAETDSLQQQIDRHQASIKEKDDSISSQKTVIIALCILAAILAGALLLGAIVLVRFIMLTRKQKKLIKESNENNALKAKFISNISAQIVPSLKKLDSNHPEVKALLSFSDHVQQLSMLESSTEKVESEEIQVLPFCEQMMDEIRGKVKDNVTLTVNSPKMSAQFNKEYVTYILRHLLNNAAHYSAADGHIWLEFKKRGAHSFQFLVSNTGATIPEERREDVFKPFLEIKDLTKGDGLGLPICRRMAVMMNGEFDIDPTFTKGTRFVLTLRT